MKVHRIKIPKSKLLAMPEAEQVLFIQAMQLLNELMILNKMVIFALNKKHDNKVLMKAQTSCVLFFIRIQIALLWEGWNLVKTRYLSGLSKEYDSRLSDTGKNALSQLNKYFRTRNSINFVRNHFSFHYHLDRTYKAILKEIENATDESDFEAYFSEISGNCFYPIADCIVTSAMVSALPGASPDPKQSLKDLAGETNAVRKDFLDFLMALMEAMLEKHVGFTSTEVAIPEPKEFSGIELPFFVRGSNDRRSRRR